MHRVRAGRSGPCFLFPPGGRGEFTLQRGVGHLHPHIFFSVAPKRKRAVHGPKEKALCGQKFSRTGKFLA